MIDGIRVTDSLKGTSKELKLDCLETYRRYAMEGLLARLSEADVDGRMSLKGGMVWWLVQALKDDARPTTDLDIHFHATKEDHKSVIELFKRANALLVDDGLRFEFGKTKKLEHTGDHEGLRINVRAIFTNNNPGQDTRADRYVDFHVDIGFGGRRSDYAVRQTFKRLYKHAPLFSVITTPTEYIAAEKISAICKLGIENTRLKDFNDLFVIAGKGLCPDKLGEAIARTFEDRNQTIPEDTCDILGLSLKFCAINSDNWRTWLKNSRRTEKMPNSLLDVVRVVDEFMLEGFRGAHGYRKDLEHTYRLSK